MVAAASKSGRPIFTGSRSIAHPRGTDVGVRVLASLGVGMRFFSSGEWRLRVARRMFFTIRSVGDYSGFQETGALASFAIFGDLTACGRPVPGRGRKGGRQSFGKSLRIAISAASPGDKTVPSKAGWRSVTMS